MSLVFDRAVSYYDQTRTLDPEREAALVDALIRETHLTPDAAVLEVGVGTGRIALPVARHVHRLFGIDLSLEMMGVLRRKLAGDPLPIAIAQADALRLPFPADTFDLAYAVHVYHLVKDWADALLDARRVLKPGGYLVVSFNKRDPDSPNYRFRRELHALAAADGIDLRRPGAESEDELLQQVLTWDPTPRVIVTGEWQATETPAELLDELARQIFSETWAIPPDRMAAYVPRLRAWAEDTFGDVTQPLPVTYDSRWLIAQKK